MTTFNTFRTLITALLIISFLSGCVWVAAGAAAVTTIDISRDRRTTGSYIDDQLIETKATYALGTDAALKGDTHFNVTSMNGVVLLTGEAPKAEQRTQAVDLVQKVPQVRQVVNEVQLADKSSMSSRSNDSWITSKVKSFMLASPDIQGQRVKVVTENGVVYLMGLATRDEAERVAAEAASTSGVQRVVKLFELLD